MFSQHIENSSLNSLIKVKSRIALQVARKIAPVHMALKQDGFLHYTCLFRSIDVIESSSFRSHVPVPEKAIFFSSYNIFTHDSACSQVM